MSENLGGSLDGLMMGQGSEQATESSEQLQARASAAQARIQSLRRDEKKSRSYDHYLAKIVTSFSTQQVFFIAFLIDHNVASEVILALFSLINTSAMQICSTDSKDFLVPFKPLLASKLGIPARQTKEIDLWWHNLYWADYTAKTGSLFELNQNTKFIVRFSTEMADILKYFLESHQLVDFNEPALESVLNARGQMLFFPTASE